MVRFLRMLRTASTWRFDQRTPRVRLGCAYNFRTPDMALSDVERFRGADAQPQAEVRTRKFGAQGVQFIA